MATISAGAIRELREKSGAGVMECKRALAESHGDIAGAAELLRARSAEVLARRQDRETREGRVFMRLTGTRAALLELRCETDFVALNERFIALGDRCADLIYSAGPDPVADIVKPEIQEAAARFGENIVAGRLGVLDAGESEVLAGYVHGDAARLGAVVRLRVDRDGEDAAFAGRELALHTAAAGPRYLSEGAIPPSLRESTVEQYRADARMLGKQPNLVETIAAGRWRSAVESVCLLSQRFFRDNSMSVADWIECFTAEREISVSVTGFLYANVGEPLSP
ncbi:translation elongation factor Ts [Salinispira pacifica]